MTKSGTHRKEYAFFLEQKKEKVIKHFNLRPNEVNSYECRNRDKLAPFEIRAMKEQTKVKKSLLQFIIFILALLIQGSTIANQNNTLGHILCQKLM